ncbi:MAG: outer membrane beta-barrel domain-containing protein [Myxococcota bacterium]
MKFQTRPSRLAGLLVLAGMLCFGSVALAQDSGEGGDAAAEADASAEDTAQDDQEELDPNDPLYWAEMRDVFTVQKRPFIKEGKFSGTLYAGIIPNNIFEQYFPLGARFNYFILENIGLELSGSYALKNDSGLSETVTDPQGIGAQEILIGDTQKIHSSLTVLWSPFYGKTSFYNSALNYFDLYVAAGAGVVVTETQPDFNTDPTSDTNVKGVLGAGMAYYFGQSVALRLDYRQFLYNTQTGGLTKASEVSLGGSLFF